MNVRLPMEENMVDDSERDDFERAIQCKGLDLSDFELAEYKKILEGLK